MKQYIGAKMVKAVPAKRYWLDNDKKIVVTINEMVAQEAISSATACEDGYKVVYPDGYASFSPKAVFEEAYRLTDGMNFGLALEAAKMGEKIARAGWNGKNAYIFLAHAPDFNTDADISEFDDQDVECLDVLVMKTAQDKFCVGWLASQTDMLADDWYIVE